MATLNYIFSKIAKNQPFDDSNMDTNKARDWYREQAQNIDKVNINNLFTNKSQNTVGSIDDRSIGRMVMFHYDPKHKKKLPFYDTFPLVFPIELYSDGFLGMNLHYLRPYNRASLMNALYETINNKNIDDKTRLVISYRILAGASKFGLFKDTVKRYLQSHVQSRIMIVEPNMWDMTLMLPTERFVKSNKNTIWTTLAR